MTALLTWLDQSRTWFQALGWAGILIYAALFVVAQALVLPVSPLAIAAGMIYGAPMGFATTVLGTGVGLSFNFLVARYLARGAVAKRLAQNEKFRLIDAAIGHEGWKIVALLRFCPLPFGLTNYCYGLTAIRFAPYVVASVLAIVPSNIFFTWLGATTQDSMQSLVSGHHQRHPFEYVLLGAGVLGGFAALTFVGKIAKKAIDKVEARRVGSPS